MPETHVELQYLKDGQQRVEEALRAMAVNLAQLVELRVSSDTMKEEVMKLRESSHKQANEMQVQGQQGVIQGKAIETLFKKYDALAESEKQIEVKQAKNGVVIALVTSVLVVILTTATKGVFH